MTRRNRQSLNTRELDVERVLAAVEWDQRARKRARGAEGESAPPRPHVAETSDKSLDTPPASQGLARRPSGGAS